MSTKIEWTRGDDGSKGESWNPIIGCSIVSPGCTNCYAMRMAARIEAMAGDGRAIDDDGYARPSAGPLDHYRGTTKIVNGHPVWTGKMSLAPTKILERPFRWRRPRRIFVNSMSDLFHEDVPDHWIDIIFGVMGRCHEHTFQVLTKRPERMQAYVSAFRASSVGDGFVTRGGVRSSDVPVGQPVFSPTNWPLANVWLGTSVERQDEAHRIISLLETPAAVRFVSAEPLLGPLDLTNIDTPKSTLNALSSPHRLDWVICGGESGPGARPMAIDWARSLRDQCANNAVAFHFKQWGEFAPALGDADDTRHAVCIHNGSSFEITPGKEPRMFSMLDRRLMVRVGKKSAGRLLDGREWNEFPATATTANATEAAALGEQAWRRS